MANSRRQPQGDYEVGFCRPPVSGQFQPGKSGNPKGGKKRETTISGAIRIELASTQKVRENGKVKTLTKAEILAKQWVRLAMEGKANALLQLAKHEPKLLTQVFAEATKAQDSGALSGDELTETDLEMMRFLVQEVDSSSTDNSYSEVQAAPEGENDD